MNESLVKYLAGLLDADGSLSFAFRRDQNREDRFFIGLQLHLSASDNVDRHGFVESLPELTGMGSTSRYGKSGQFVTWAISRRADLEMLLPRLIKHMIIKAQHWHWMLGSWREWRGRRYGQANICGQERESLSQAVKESRKLRVGPLREKNFPSWAWVAGYLDGDGCYGYRKGAYRSYKGRLYIQWTINVTAVAHVTDAVGLELLQKTFGGAIIEHGQSKNVLVWRRALGYQNRSFALTFLGKMARHSRLKRHKIDQMIHHHRQRLSVPGTAVQATV